jgi:hypothetical protein
MHFQGRDIYEVPGTEEFFMKTVFSQYVANVLAKEAFNALSEFLNAVHVALRHTPCTIRRVGRTRPEFLYSFFYAIVYRHVGNQVADYREGFHRLQRDWLSFRHIAHARHTHELGQSVDLGRAGSAFSGFAVPTDGEIRSLLRLDLVDGIQHDHPFRDFSVVLSEGVFVGAPYAECDVCHNYDV